MKQRIFTLLLIALIYLSACQKDGVLPAVKPVDQAINQTPGLNHDSTTTTQSPATPAFQGVVTNIIKGAYLRLQMAQNPVNTDEIIISFDPNASVNYVRTEDASTLQGFGQVSLSSLSSDNVALSINALPLPPTSYSIGLAVNAKTDGTYTLNMTTMNAIPTIFEIWLKDNYRKDSLDYRSNTSYTFDIYKADPNSFGTGRFSLVVRQNQAMEIHLLNFTAKKATGGTQVTWITENEYNYTGFTVERSTDNGKTFTSLTGFTSTGNKGSYSFTDQKPVTGTDMYRLRVQDLNGAITTSGTVSLVY